MLLYFRGMCRFPKKEISEISIIQDNTEIHIDPNPRCEIYRNFGNFLEITSKFLGNFRNLIDQNNNHIHIDPKPRGETCGNFRNFLEITWKFLKFNQLE